MIDTLASLDENIFLFFNGMHSPFFDNFMMLFTGRFIWIPLYVTIFCVVIRCFKLKTAAVAVLALGFAILLTDQTCATLIRPVVERLRPANPANPLSTYVHIVDGYRGGSFGFPSCHSANSFALVTFLACLIRKQRFIIPLVLWATLNSYTRLYLGVHYPGDLLVGAVIGAFFAILCYKAFSFLTKSSQISALSFSSSAIPTNFLNGTISVKTIDSTTLVIAATIICMAIISCCKCMLQ